MTTQARGKTVEILVTDKTYFVINKNIFYSVARTTGVGYPTGIGYAGKKMLRR